MDKVKNLDMINRSLRLLVKLADTIQKDTNPSLDKNKITSTIIKRYVEEIRKNL